MPTELEQKQLELEAYMSRAGTELELGQPWQIKAAKQMVGRKMDRFVAAIGQVYEDAQRRGGLGYRFFALCSTKEQAIACAAETLHFLATCDALVSGRELYKMATVVGEYCEVAMFLQAYKSAQNLKKQFDRVCYRKMNIKLLKQRFMTQGWELAKKYRALDLTQKQGLGELMIRLIAKNTGIVQIYHDYGPKGSVLRYLGYGDAYWEACGKYKRGVEVFAHLYLPMIVPPLPPSKKVIDAGGYLTIRRPVIHLDADRYPKLVGQADRLFQSIKQLQETPLRFDTDQIALVRKCFKYGWPVEGMPSRATVEQPVRSDYKEDNKAYWRHYWRWQVDCKHNARRASFAKFMTCLTALERQGIDLQKQEIYQPWSADYRGRMNPVGGEIKTNGTAVVRSCLKFAASSPMRGNEDAFSWVLGEYVGLPRDASHRHEYLRQNRELVAAIGKDPEQRIQEWRHWKEPWLGVQLAREWSRYMGDSRYCTNAMFRADQTNSGWGHLAAMFGDTALAQQTNLIGTDAMDFYTVLGRHATDKLYGISRVHSKPSVKQAAEWWIRAGLERSLIKELAVPALFGASMTTLKNVALLILAARDDRFAYDNGLRNFEAAFCIALAVSRAINSMYGSIRSLSGWMAACSRQIIKAGFRTCWRTNNGLLVESWKCEGVEEKLELHLAGACIKIRTTVPNEAKQKICPSRNAADFTHSCEAAVLQNFICSHPDMPLVTTHDCVATVLGELNRARAGAAKAFGDFYRKVDPMQQRIDEAAHNGIELPARPPRGNLDYSRIGENLHLFC